MKSKIALNTLRGIKKSPGRFIAVMSIIAIGCCFFVGVKSSCGYMKNSAWKYYEMQQLADIQVKSTLGLTEDDFNAVLECGNFETGDAGYSADVYVDDENGNIPVKLISYSEDISLNIPYLTEGRLPQNSGECLADADAKSPLSYSVGDTVTFVSATDDDISDTLTVTEYTVVGLCKSPMYVSFERGSTTVGSGTLSAFFYIPDEDFSLDVYTDIYLKVNGAADAEPFSDEYNQIVADEEDKLEALADERLEIRKTDAFADAKQEIEDAKAEIEDAKAELEDAEKEYQDGYDEYTANAAEVADARQQYEDAVAEYESSLVQLDDGSTASAELLSTCNILDGYIEKYDMMYQRQLFDSTLEDIQEIQTIYDKYGLDIQIADYLAVYIITNPDKDPVGKATAKAAITQVNETVHAAAAQAMSTADTQIQTVDSIQDQFNETLQQIGEAESQLASAKKTLDEAAEEIENGKSEIADAEQEISDAEKELEDAADEAKWYVWNRDEFNPGCLTYGEDAERVDAIAKVFPVFFIIIAALMCATTMSRMVEEQRTETGVLKALGYSSSAIIMQYVLYAVSASVIGGVIGTALGFKLLPNIIYIAYCTMYNYPIFETPFRPAFALACIVVSILCTGVATVYTTSKSLNIVPAQLIRPKPPKDGRRIFLEKIHFIWNRLNFTSKVTFRNLLRYKTRFFVTVVGVAGSCALMVAGIGLKYSISCIADLQYDEIFIYDAIAIPNDTADEEEIAEYLDYLDNSELVEGYTFAVQESKEITSESTSFEAYVFVPSSLDELNDYIVLRERTTDEPIILDDGCVINEKLSRLLDADIGDTLYIEGSDRPLTITDICENYTYNYCYITMDVYEEMFGAADENVILINTGGTPEKDVREDFSREMLLYDGILSVTFLYDGAESFRNLVSSMDLIVIVVVAFAAALSFVILLNLANITVNERERELATIKVLGFYDHETDAYIYRESIISTFIGIVAGLILGIFLEGFVIRTSEVDAVMFSPEIPAYVFVLAAALMILFSVIVNVILHFKLKKIDMVVSMKAIE